MSLLTLKYRGEVVDLPEEDRHTLFDRTPTNDDIVRDTVAAIIDLVKREGDDALRSLAREYDQVKLTAIEVPKAVWQQALDGVDATLVDAMRRSARNIEAVHRAVFPKASRVEPEPGIVVERHPHPLGRIGVYAPGGKASYPSSVLMGAIPARVAGVREVIVCSPPDKSGMPPTGILAACAIAGVDRVFAVGGAGAVAAMAFGTQTIPRVDAIVGPGNAWVTEAKVQVASNVVIDSPAGPSELLVLADDTADAAMVARELIAQAEHDEMACAVAMVLGREMAEKVEASLRVQAAATKRASIVKKAIEGQGGVLVATTREQMSAFATMYAPEHLLVVMDDAMSIVNEVRGAGTIFVGGRTSVAFGDYMTGANHVLPTGGAARAYSGLSLDTFYRWTTVQTVSAVAAASLAESVGVFADAEGLDAHARAARAQGNAR
jgi:histidinol dehydrogenase